MPPLKKTASKPATENGQTNPTTHTTDPTPVLYPDLHIWGVPLDSKDGKRVKFNPVTHLTGPRVKELIGLETNTEYAKVQAAKNPGTKPEDECNQLGPLALDKDPVTGEMFRCKFNGKNRPHDMGYTMRYLQDMLNRRWAGTLGVAWDTVNGETCIVGNMGNVVSAQKRMIAFWFLWEIWHTPSHELHARAREMWPEEPTLPIIMVFGVSEHPDILRTLDNVQPRSEMDVVYTTGMFDTVRVDLGIKDSTGAPRYRDLWPAEKKELAKLMARATDMLWKRTGVSANIFLAYQTHGESVDFMNRHSSLRKCVVHVFHENGSRITYEEQEGGRKRKILWRGISGLKVSPGDCAALMYMMATSGGSASKYNLANRSERNEDMLDFSRYDKAAEFMALLANPESTVGQAMKDVHRPQVGEQVNEFRGVMFSKQEGGSREERLAVIAKAWLFWIADQELNADVLRLGYKYKHDIGSDVVVEFSLVEKIKVGGIDMGEPEKEGKDTGGETGTTEYAEAPSTDEDEVWDGVDQEEGDVEAALAEVVEDREERQKVAASLVEETPEQERARRAVVEQGKGVEKEKQARRKPIERKR